MYEYAPLTEKRHTRLIHLQPGKWQDPLSCHITTCTLDTSPPYSALSYTWGSLGRSHMIRCDEQILSVTENLWKILRHLRHETTTGVFWIDAVCINQTDISERNTQIQLMKDIYRGAQEVVIWIGEENKDTPDGIRVLKQFPTLSSEGWPLDFETTPYIEELLRKMGLPEIESPVWKSVIDLYRRTWFTRIWVIQELSVARSAVVYCGQQSCPWSCFSLAVRCVDRIMRRNAYKRRLLFEYNRFLAMDFSRGGFQEGAKFSLLGTSSMARSSYSMDPRDKIFGLLGLASDGKDLLPNPDYSTPVAEVYQTLTKKMISKDNSLEVLGEVQDPRWTLIEELPSWAVDWSAQPRVIPFRLLRYRPNFLAAGSSKVCVGTSPIPGTLVLTGVSVDKVRECGLPLFRNQPISSHLIPGANPYSTSSIRSLGFKYIAQARWEQWESIALKLQSYPTRRSVGEAYYHTLMAGVHIPDSPHDLDFLYHGYLSNSDFLYGPHFFSCTDKPSQEPCAHWRPYASAVEAACDGRCFITTKRGYMGLASPSTKPGDLICVFSGGKTPYILRPSGAGFYRFICDCYIEGLMDGEAMDSQDGEDKGLQEFVLR